LDIERIESIKAGIVGGFCFVIAQFFGWLLNYFILLKNWEFFVIFDLKIGLNLTIEVGILFFTGLLFGVTYRYIIRCDNNSHLKDGAVFAFGFVRSLVFWEINNNLSENILPLIILGIETIFAFLFTRLVIDLALDKQFIKKFN
jgi:hypothetical protein